MQETSSAPKTELYDLTVYTFAYEQLGSKEQAATVLKYVRENLSELHKKYPPDCEDYQLYLCMFTNEVIKRLTKNWAADAVESVSRSYVAQPPEPISFVYEPPDEQPAPPEEEPEEPRRAKKRRRRKKPRQRRKRPKAPPEEQAPVRPREAAPEGFTFFQLLAVLLCAALMLWMLVGLLMALDVIPFYDLGYTWFNQHLLPVF